MHNIFAKTKVFVFDMDGTFYLGSRMLPGAGDFVGSLAARGLDFRFFTNNSSHARVDCLRKLSRMGFPVEEEKVVLSTDVAAAYLNEHHRHAQVYLLGNEKMARELTRAGVTLVDPPADEAPDLILLGFDTDLTYARIHKAANWLAEGLPYLATHPDKNCPVPGGFMPDTGAMIALFDASTGRVPKVLGKPERTTVDYLAKHLQCAPEKLCFVGDRLETDIAIGRHGSPAVLVLTGVTTREDYEAQQEFHADLVVETLPELADYL